MAWATETEVAVVGAGPVGLTLAGLLAARGRDVVVLERRSAEADKHPTANHLGVRAMELLRRMGLADRLRLDGFDPDHGDDRIWATAAGGRELYRIERPANRAPADSEHSPTREIWCPKEHLDPALETFARDHGATVVHDAPVSGLATDAGVAGATVEWTAGNERRHLSARWVVGCDGTHSTVRQLADIGLEFEGEIPVTLQSTYFRAPDLGALLPPGGTQYNLLSAGGGMLIAIDGSERWRIHFPSFDDAWTVERAHGELRRVFGADLDIEVLSVIPWRLGSSLVERWRDGPLLLAGDAAHQATPYGGLGMNYGLLDAEALAWRIDAIAAGWGADGLLDDYGYERAAATRTLLAYQGLDFDADPPTMTTKLVATPAAPEIDDDGPVGDAARTAFAIDVALANHGHFDNPGVDLDQRYEGSPGIVSDGSPEPPWDVRSYEPVVRPGHRMPHLVTSSGASTIDTIGDGFVVFAADPVDVGPLVGAARERGVPVTIGSAPVERSVLVRPDGFVAWRAPRRDGMEWDDVIDTVTGQHDQGGPTS